MVTPSIAPTAETKDRVHASARRFRVPVTKLKEALEHAPAEDRELCLWLHAYCLKRDCGKAELGQLLRKPGGSWYAADSVIQILSGTRHRKGEPVGDILDAIRTLRRVEEERGEQADSGFIETRLYRVFEERALKAFRRQRILHCFGRSQIGKSEIAREFKRRHNHGQTILVEMPAGAALGKFTSALARQIGITGRHNTTERQDAIFDYFDSRTQLIIDEAHQAFETTYTATALNTLSWLRQLYNQCRCSIVFLWTDEDSNEFQTGPHRKRLVQLWRRRTEPLYLPAFPPDDDAAKFALAYGLHEAADETVTVQLTAYDDRGRERTLRHQDNPLRLQRQVLKDEGLGVWIGILQDASDMAREQKRAITWGAVIKAHAQSLADAEIFK
jgi:hypothetical protein